MVVASPSFAKPDPPAGPVVDLHVHMAAEASGFAGNHVAPGFRSGLGFRWLLRRLGLPLQLQGDALDQAFRDRLAAWLEESSLDLAVLLALDAHHDEDGRRDLSRTSLAVDNDYVADVAAAMPKARFGASVHPYRPDALDELDRLADRRACLVKWLPSAQGIRPDDPRCFPFYERLAELGLPLLSHTGWEHTLSRGLDAWNDPRLLKPALDRGVTVIAAHCGLRLFLHEPSWFAQWREMALSYPRFYGDLGAFLACTRMPTLARIRKSPELAARVLYGSDFPTPAGPMQLLGLLGPREALRLGRIANPLERSLASLRAAGLPEGIFRRAASLLRLG